MRHRHLIAAVVLSSALVTACGSGAGTSGGAAGTRTVDVDMRDNTYSPDHVTVRAGDTIRFVFHNRGNVAHDAFLGDEQAQMDPEREMSSMNDMHPGDEDAVTFQPGGTGQLTHTFHTGDEVLIGCHDTGDYAAGMQLNLTVS